MRRHEFRAMGTHIELLLDAEPGPEVVLGFTRVENEFRRLEAALSRFEATSELSLLNALGSIEASEDLLAVVRAALDARERTGGRFDPTVHRALVAAGYDRSFELVESAHRAATLAPPERGGGEVRVLGRRIELGEDVRLDLGGIAKGYAVDRAVGLLASYGPCLVNAGGDVAVAGTPAAGVWPVGVELPSESLTLGLERGALATSGRDRRRWTVGDDERHHLIDPRSGRPSASNLLRVTVVAATCTEAEIRAKALFLAGEEAAVREADELGVPALLVTGDGRVRKAGGLA